MAKQRYSEWATAYAEKHPFQGRFLQWGPQGAGRAFGRGAAMGAGFWADPSGKMRFLGGAGAKKVALGLGIGAGIGAAVYAATDNPLYGIAAGGGALLASKAVRQAGLRLMGPLMVGAGAVQGFREEGLWGGAKGAVGEAATWGAYEVGFGAVKTAISGTKFAALGTQAASLAKFAMHPLVMLTALAGVGAYYGVKGLAKLGRESRETEFVGDMAAFRTQAAHTMRQRALQEIGRSHTNSRTILGNEAQLLHLR